MTRSHLLLVVLLACMAAPGLRAEEAAVGRPAPGFELPSSAGLAVSLSSFRGHYVALEWTNPDCPFVGKHYESGNMQRLQRDLIARGGVWLTIDSSAAGHAGHVTPAQARALLATRKSAPSAFLIDADGRVGHLYAAKTTPDMFLVDPQGLLVYAGGIDSIASTNTQDITQATPYFRNAIDRAMAHERIDPSTTRSYGCSIKY